MFQISLCLVKGVTFNNELQKYYSFPAALIILDLEFHCLRSAFFSRKTQLPDWFLPGQQTVSD